MDFNRELKKVGGSHVLIVPRDIVVWLGLNDAEQVVIRPDEGKHGKFMSLWKKTK